VSALVDVADVVKRFGSLTALDRVSLRVEPGEVVGLLGANGAGKSTLVKLILGLLGPDAGHVFLFGTPPSRAGRARVGYVPQGLGLYPDLTIAENLGFVAGAFAVEMPVLEPDLEAARDRLVGSLSLGLRRRTAFVAAISHRPDLYLLDEPTSGVGPTGRADLWSTIAEVAERGAGVLVSTHYMEEAEQCHRVMVLANGVEVARGSTTEIIAGIEAVEVDAPDWAAALAALDAAGLRPGLVGKRLRMVGAKEDGVRAVLAAAGVTGGVRRTPAGFEEAFVALSAH
jgi:ABC-2 type transport system ATP-binding protein/ribosome-dependent ATPase